MLITAKQFIGLNCLIDNGCINIYCVVPLKKILEETELYWGWLPALDCMAWLPNPLLSDHLDIFEPVPNTNDDVSAASYHPANPGIPYIEKDVLLRAPLYPTFVPEIIKLL